MTSPLMSSSSSSGPTTSTGVPAMTFSSPFPISLTPSAPLISLWWMYSDLILSSRLGGGVNSPRISVTTGPSNVHITTLSPSLRYPFTTITSTVMPMPSIAFTSSTVHCRFPHHIICFQSFLCAIWQSSSSTSWTPSPEIAEVGTSGTKSEDIQSSSPISQKMFELIPCSASCTLASSARDLNSPTVPSGWLSRASRMGASGQAFQA
mmetsp:Transcript_24324/g.48407  ORF Transcript_24324/g.48407 Transcript_24324/m.48407 type:complete len:207 (+) Transcript_24324:1095-1715(+)